MHASRVQDLQTKGVLRDPGVGGKSLHLRSLDPCFAYLSLALAVLYPLPVIKLLHEDKLFECCESFSNQTRNVTRVIHVKVHQLIASPREEAINQTG